MKLYPKDQSKLMDVFGKSGSVDYLKFYFTAFGKKQTEMQTLDAKSNEKYLEGQLKEWKEEASKLEMENQYFKSQNAQFE